MDDTKKFTHLAVEKVTQRKVAVLAKVFDENIYELVARWAGQDWEQALENGLVTDAMLEQRAPRVVEEA